MREKNQRAGAAAPAPIGSAVEGLPAGLLRPGYRHSAAPDRSRRLFSRRWRTVFGFAEAVAAEQKDLRVFDEPIHDCRGDGRIKKNVAPFREGRVGCNECGPLLAVASGDDLIKQIRRLLI